MKRGVEAVLESDVKEETEVLTDSRKIPYIIGCLRRGEDYGNTIGWKGGDCLTCIPDYIAKDRGDFIPNNQCEEYIPCRVIDVVVNSCST